MSEKRGYIVESPQEYENVSKIFSFPVAFCTSEFKGRRNIENCSSILYEYKVAGMPELKAFCEQQDEFHTSKICVGLIQFQAMVFNITQYFELSGELFFYAYVYPLVALLVLLSNVLLVLTLLRGRFSSAAHLLLVAIALMDTLTIVLPTPYLFYYLTLGNYLSYISYNNCVAIAAILMYASPICHGISVWLNFGLALQRYSLLWTHTYINSSLLRRRFCVIFILVIIPGVSAVFLPGILTLPDYPVVYVYSSNDEEIMTTLKTPLMNMDTQLRLAQVYLARCFFVQVIPCMGMLTFCVEIAVKYKSVVKAHSKMTTNERGSGDWENSQTLNLVFMYMLAMFLVAEVPVAGVAFTAAMAAVNNGRIDDNVRLVAFITNIIILFTSPLNLLVYTYQGDWFRHNLKQLLSWKCRRPRQESRLEGSTQSRTIDCEE
ncbi:hypothetical protein KP79_PYT00390 [Mizuhopecten yessoensis]|uniref:G-protein coupled receptors family 1 profile domain-containing protein n=2 Tax=Mizuhopecten yessoensis TaxID=6573 RepID=A0A210QYQ4_MIZYE|nr:hypothetical protein KP79_PYT00390 [Mizuhopecten yessoensis]